MEKRGKRENFYCTWGQKYDFRKKGGGGKNINYFDNIQPCNCVKYQLKPKSAFFFMYRISCLIFWKNKYLFKRSFEHIFIECHEYLWNQKCTSNIFFFIFLSHKTKLLEKTMCNTSLDHFYIFIVLKYMLYVKKDTCFIIFK